MEYTPELINFICTLQQSSSVSSSYTFYYIRNADKITTMVNKFLPDSKITPRSIKNKYSGEGKESLQYLFTSKTFGRILNKLGWTFNKEKHIDKSILENKELLEVYITTYYDLSGGFMLSKDVSESSICFSGIDKNKDFLELAKYIGCQNKEISTFGRRLNLKYNSIAIIYDILNRNRQYLSPKKLRTLDAIEYVYTNSFKNL